MALSLPKKNFPLVIIPTAAPSISVLKGKKLANVIAVDHQVYTVDREYPTVRKLVKNKLVVFNKLTATASTAFKSQPHGIGAYIIDVVYRHHVFDIVLVHRISG